MVKRLSNKNAQTKVQPPRACLASIASQTFSFAVRTQAAVFWACSSAESLGAVAKAVVASDSMGLSKSFATLALTEDEGYGKTRSQ